MIEAIQRFIAELRTAGLRVSPSEAIDAARAAQAVGVERRNLFRAALKTTLSKMRDDSAAFDRAFERFFAAPAADIGGKPRGAESSTPGAGRSRRPAKPDDETPPAAGSLRSPDKNEARTRPQRLKVILADRSGRNMTGGATVATVASAAGQKAMSPASSRRAAPRPRSLSPVDPARSAAQADPRRIDLSARLARAEEDRIAREVPKLIREIRLRAGRRFRRGSAGKIWTAGIMRRNIGTGGVPFVIPYRRRRPRRTRTIVLADVSWSVMRASSLFLLMAREFLAADARVSVHLFVDRCVEATDTISRWRGPESIPFSRLLDAIEGLDPMAASDYGRAFYQAAYARHGVPRTGGRDTILVVLGDARNNLRDPQPWVFEELASRCRRVIWLNPEPVSRWNTGDSDLAEYSPHCDVMCEAMNLEGIARGISVLVGALRGR